VVSKSLTGKVQLVLSVLSKGPHSFHSVVVLLPLPTSIWTTKENVDSKLGAIQCDGKQTLRLGYFGAFVL
jgi:hypothetical protein